MATLLIPSLVLLWIGNFQLERTLFFFYTVYHWRKFSIIDILPRDLLKATVICIQRRRRRPPLSFLHFRSILSARRTSFLSQPLLADFSLMPPTLRASLLFSLLPIVYIFTILPSILFSLSLSYQKALYVSLIFASWDLGYIHHSLSIYIYIYL